MHTIIKQPTDRYSLDDADLPCGTSIEVLIGGHWIAGRMEHDGGYYIHIPDHDNPDRFTRLDPGGMRARFTRKKPRPTFDEMLDAVKMAYRSARVTHGAQSELCVKLENVITKAEGK